MKLNLINLMNKNDKIYEGLGDSSLNTDNLDDLICDKEYLDDFNPEEDDIKIINSEEYDYYTKDPSIVEHVDYLSTQLFVLKTYLAKYKEEMSKIDSRVDSGELTYSSSEYKSAVAELDTKYRSIFIKFPLTKLVDEKIKYKRSFDFIQPSLEQYWED